MLLGQDSSRHQIYHLFALLNSFKRCPERDLSLSKSHIPTDQAVHNLAALHIRLRRLNCFQLIFRFFVRKQLFKFFLPDCIRAALKSGI